MIYRRKRCIYHPRNEFVTVSTRASQRISGKTKIDSLLFCKLHRLKVCSEYHNSRRETLLDTNNTGIPNFRKSISNLFEDIYESEHILPSRSLPPMSVYTAIELHACPHSLDASCHESLHQKRLGVFFNPKTPSWLLPYQIGI